MRWRLWFGSYVTMRWWDDLWLDEALATYLCVEFTGGWAGFGYREKARAYRADELPGRLPVSSPVASSAQAESRPAALTYCKGAAVIRQLSALIGEQALRTGMRDYLARFGGNCGTSQDLVACWSRASGRELAGWADTWLHSEGAPTLRACFAAEPGVLAGPGPSLVVTQDPPGQQLVQLGLYDRARTGRGLRRRQLVQVELTGERTVVPVTLGAGEAVPDAVVANDGDLGYARITFDERSWQALAEAALEVDDPVTEAVCWNAAWQLVTGACLPAASFADLVIRRLADGQAGLPANGAEVLLERAVSCADVYAPVDHRTGLRERIADSTLAAARRGARSSERSPSHSRTAHIAKTSLTCWPPGWPGTRRQRTRRWTPNCGHAPCSPCPPAGRPGSLTSTRCQSLIARTGQHTRQRAWRCSQTRQPRNTRGQR